MKLQELVNVAAPSKITQKTSDVLTIIYNIYTSFTLHFRYMYLSHLQNFLNFEINIS